MTKIDFFYFEILILIYFYFKKFETLYSKLYPLTLNSKSKLVNPRV